MDEKPRRRQSDWHRLLFYGSVAVAGVLFLARSAGIENPFALLTDPSTRNMIRRFHRNRDHRIVQWFPSLFRDEAIHASKPSPSVHPR